jgi:hypothetical protein
MDCCVRPPKTVPGFRLQDGFVVFARLKLFQDSVGTPPSFGSDWK